MLKIKRINRDEGGHREIEELLISKGFSSLFFHSPFTIQIWLNNEINELYLATFGSEKILLVYNQVRKKDVRFFFEYPSEAFIKAVIEHFDAKYIGINELRTATEHSIKPYEEKEELFADLATLAEMKDPRIRKEYNRCVKKHPHLHFKEIELSDLDAARSFLGEWQHTRTETQNKFARISSDLSFISMYADSKPVHGAIVYDGEKAIAIAFLVESREEGTLISVSNKILRGYTELGTYLYVEKARLMKAKGFSKANLEKINNEFKNKFRLNSESRIAYSHEAWIKEGWKFTPGFLQRFI